MSPNHALLASGGAEACVLIREMTECTPISMMPRMESAIRSLSFSHDSFLLASAGEDTKIEISEAESSAHVHSIQLDAEVGSLSFSPKDHILAYSVENKNRPSVFLFSKITG
jgi:WD40 repeat protein